MSGPRGKSMRHIIRRGRTHLGLDEEGARGVGVGQEVYLSSQVCVIGILSQLFLHTDERAASSALTAVAAAAAAVHSAAREQPGTCSLPETSVETG